MAAVDDLKAILVRVDTATTNIAKDIQDIKAKIGTGIEIVIRGQKFPATIEKKPLYKK